MWIKICVCYVWVVWVLEFIWLVRWIQLHLFYDWHSIVCTRTKKWVCTHGQLGSKNVQATPLGNSNPWQSVNMWLLIFVLVCIRLIRWHMIEVWLCVLCNGNVYMRTKKHDCTHGQPEIRLLSVHGRSMKRVVSWEVKKINAVFGYRNQKSSMEILVASSV